MTYTIEELEKAIAEAARLLVHLGAVRAAVLARGLPVDRPEYSAWKGLLSSSQAVSGAIDEAFRLSGLQGVESERITLAGLRRKLEEAAQLKGE